ncbi:ribokinase [Actinocatenispora thailandica]|uniref:ribokinase n=1 Tax=Actinocatenispora thailandica TaxID=227318 RepID=UPI0031D1239A
MSRVVVVGSANVDVTTQVPTLPAPGQTLLATGTALLPGGKGANQAVAASRWGIDTELYAAVGADSFGRLLRSALAEQGVGLDRLIETGSEPTGLALVTVAADAENTIVVAPGANSALTAGAVADLPAHLGAGDVVLLQLEVPLATAAAAATAALSAGARVVLNAAPPPPASGGLAELLAGVDVLVVNETEATALAGTGPPGETAGWLPVAAALRALGPAAVVITLGGDGAVACAGDEAWHQAALPAAVLDTTGAGDAFCGVLAAALADGRSLPRAVRAGCAAGAAATEGRGAQAALYGRDQLDARMGEGA